MLKLFERSKKMSDVQHERPHKSIKRNQIYTHLLDFHAWNQRTQR